MERRSNGEKGWDGEGPEGVGNRGYGGPGTALIITDDTTWL